MSKKTLITIAAILGVLAVIFAVMFFVRNGDVNTANENKAKIDELNAEYTGLQDEYTAAVGKLESFIPVVAEETASVEVTATEDAATVEVTTAEDATTVEVTTAAETPSMEVTAAAETPSMEVTAAAEAPTVEVTAAEEVPSVEVTATEEVPSVEVTAAEEVPSVEVTAAEEVPSVEVTAAEEVPSVEVTAAEEVPSVEVTAAEEVPSVEVTAAEEVPSVEVTAAVDAATVEEGFNIEGIASAADITAEKLAELGWTVVEDGTVTEELQAKFDAAFANGFVGASYTADKLIATKTLEDGTVLYLFEGAQTVIVPGAEPAEGFIAIAEKADTVEFREFFPKEIAE